MVTVRSVGSALRMSVCVMQSVGGLVNSSALGSSSLRLPVRRTPPKRAAKDPRPQKCVAFEPALGHKIKNLKCYGTAVLDP